MKIYLPNSAFLGNIDPFLRSFDAFHPERLEITANKKWISVHPVVLCMIAALGSTVDKKKITCEPLEAKSKHYFERMELFKMLDINSGIHMSEHEPAGRFIPLTQIKSSMELTEFITEMIPLLHLNPVQVEPIKYVVSELVRNVFEHSESKFGAILCAQYYLDSKTIRIGIADTGVGIKKTINRVYPAKTDSQAIELALVPGITGTTSKVGGSEENAGAGLFFIKSIAKVNRDFFIIYSGKALYKLLRTESKKQVRLYADPRKDKHSAKENLPYWQGTIVGIDINLHQKNEFSNLLDAIRRAYAQGIKERKKIRYRSAKFI